SAITSYVPSASGINIGWQSPGVGPDFPHAGDLPSANDPVQHAIGVAEQLLAASDRKVNDKVPAELVLGRVGITLVVEEPVALLRIGRHGAGKELVHGHDGIGGLCVVCVPVDQERVADDPEGLEGDAL